MQDSEHDDRVGVEHEENAVRESTREHAANFGAAAQATELAGVLLGARDGSVNFVEEFIPESGSLLVIPKGGVGDVGFGLGADDEPAGHGRSLPRISSKASRQGRPLSRSF